MPCNVLSYEKGAGKYLIQFDPQMLGLPTKSGPKQKHATRLNILFDDEDKSRFDRRVAICRQRRDEMLSQRRYNALVDMQSEHSFPPVQQSILINIVKRLMSRSPHLVSSPEQQLAVEGLLVETRHQYARGSKEAIVEYRRHQPGEAKRMEVLNLPLLTEAKNVPFLAVIEIPERSSPMRTVSRTIRVAHYGYHPKALDVVLSLWKAADKIKEISLIDVEDPASPKSTIKLPMTLFEYQDHQDDHFHLQKDKVCMYTSGTGGDCFSA